MQQKLQFQKWYLFSSPAIAGTTLYVGSTQGKLKAVDLSDLKVVWEFETDGAKAHGASYTKSDGTPDLNSIYGSDFYDDMVVGVNRIMSMGAIVSSPVIAESRVYFSSADGNLYAIE